MYCPKCSQPEPSDAMRYCARCGFPLSGVALLLEHDGALPQLTTDPHQEHKSSRNRSLGESAVLTTVAWAIVLVATFWFDAGGPFEIIGKIAAVLFSLVGLIGLIKFLHAFLFVNDRADQPSPDALQNAVSARTSLSEPNQTGLPAHESLPLSDYPRRANTKEMAPRPSVTENTTRLLDDYESNHGE